MRVESVSLEELVFVIENLLVPSLVLTAVRADLIIEALSADISQSHL